MSQASDREKLLEMWTASADAAPKFVPDPGIVSLGLELHRIANALEDIAAHLAKPRIVVDTHCALRDLGGPRWGDR